MPKVTLLRSDSEDYTIVLGRKVFIFYGGAPKDVPVAVALIARRVRDSQKQSVFQIDELPKIVSPKPQVNIPAPEVIEQTVLGRPRQMRVDEWL